MTCTLFWTPIPKLMLHTTTLRLVLHMPGSGNGPCIHWGMGLEHDTAAVDNPCEIMCRTELRMAISCWGGYTGGLQGCCGGPVRCYDEELAKLRGATVGVHTAM